MRNNLVLKITPLIILINIPLLLGLFLKFDAILIITISLALSLISIFLIFKLIRQKENKLNTLEKTLDQSSKNQTQTYAKIAYERDILSADKNRLATIFSSIPEAIIVLDLHKQVILANAEAEKLTGFQESEMYKKRIDELIRLLDKENIPIPTEEYCPINLENQEAKSSYISIEPITLGGKAYKKAKVKLSANTITGSIRTDLGCILIFHEVSQETSLQSMQFDFVSMASHELRTPITSIIGYLNVLIDEGKDKFDPQQKDFLYRILAGAKQLSNLVSNLLNVSKVERGAISINTQPLEYYKVLSQIVDDNRVQATQKNISLGLIDTDPSLPKVQADSVRMVEVLNNLISNAINYTPGGGTISVSAKLAGQEVVTSVSDTGKGIPPEAINNLFTKFYRVSTAQDVSSNSKGTGLGLYLSKSIIELQHGKIWVQSKVGKGSTFYFTLPVTAIQSTGNNVLPKLQPSPTGKGLTVI